MSELQLSVSVLNYRTWDLTKGCLRSCEKHFKPLSYEIILTDNTPAGEAGGVPPLGDGEFKNLTLIRNKENAGFGRAHNQAEKISSGRYFLILNSDTEILEETRIKELIACLDSSELAAAAGVKQINHGNEDIGPVAFRFFPDNRQIFNLYFFNKQYEGIKGEYDEKYLEVAHLNGAFILFKRDAFQEVGGFSPEFFIYLEDTDICFKLYKKGYKIVYFPGNAIIHEGGESSKKEGNYSRIFGANYLNYHKSLIIYMAKNYSLFSSLLCKYILTLSFFCKSIWNYIGTKEHTKSKGYWWLWKQIVKI